MDKVENNSGVTQDHLESTANCSQDHSESSANSSQEASMSNANSSKDDSESNADPLQDNSESNADIEAEPANENVENEAGRVPPQTLKPWEWPLQSYIVGGEVFLPILHDTIVPYWRQQLIEDIRPGQFSLFIKVYWLSEMGTYLAFAINYISKSKNELVFKFMTLKQLEGRGEDGAKCVKDAVQEFGLNMKSLVSICSDHAANTPNNLAIYKNLKEEFPHIYFMPLANNSMKTATCFAGQHMPYKIEELIETCFIWFNISRAPNPKYDTNEHFKLLYGDDISKLPEYHEFFHYNWNTYLCIVEGLSKHWDQNRDFFAALAEVSKDMDCYEKYDYLHQSVDRLLQKDSNKVYMAFLTYMLQKVDVVDKLCQQNPSIDDPLLRVTSLNNLVADVGSMVFEEDMETLKQNPNLGEPTETLLKELNDADKEKKVREACIGYAETLYKELKARNTCKIPLYQHLPQLYQALKVPRFDIKELLELDEVKLMVNKDDLETINKEWIDLINFDQYNPDDKTDVKFWCKVNEITDDNGQYKYKHLSDLSLKLLTLPHCSEVSEKVFYSIKHFDESITNLPDLRLVNGLLTMVYSIPHDGFTGWDIVMPVNALMKITCKMNKAELERLESLPKNPDHVVSSESYGTLLDRYRMVLGLYSSPEEEENEEEDIFNDDEEDMEDDEDEIDEEDDEEDCVAAG